MLRPYLTTRLEKFSKILVAVTIFPGLVFLDYLLTFACFSVHLIALRYSAARHCRLKAFAGQSSTVASSKFRRHAHEDVSLIVLGENIAIFPDLRRPSL